MVIFLYGEDSFRSRQKLAEIKQKYFESDKSGSGLSSFEADSTKDISGKLKVVFGTSNLFASKRLLIVKNLIALGSEKEQKDVLAYANENKKRIGEDKELVAVFWEGGMPKRNNALFKFLDKEAKKQNFEKLSGTRLSQWIVSRIKAFDGAFSISRAALDKLIAYTSGDSYLIDNEIRKLVDYSDRKMINEKDIDVIVKANLDSNIFKTIDALGGNNKKQALELMHNHLEKGEDPFYIFSMFVYQFRNMLKISDLNERGMREHEISKSAKLHPFVVKKGLAQVRNFPFSRLKQIYGKIGAVDLMIKTGKIDIELALDKLVSEL